MSHSTLSPQLVTGSTVRPRCSVNAASFVEVLTYAVDHAILSVASLLQAHGGTTR